MEKIIIVWRFKEGEKKARLRFRLREGRAVDVFHKSVDSKVDFRQNGFEKGASGRPFQR